MIQKLIKGVVQVPCLRDAVRQGFLFWAQIIRCQIVDSVLFLLP